MSPYSDLKWQQPPLESGRSTPSTADHLHPCQCNPNGPFSFQLQISDQLTFKPHEYYNTLSSKWYSVGKQRWAHIMESLIYHPVMHYCKAFIVIYNYCCISSVLSCSYPLNKIVAWKSFVDCVDKRTPFRLMWIWIWHFNSWFTLNSVSLTISKIQLYSI